MDTPPLPALCPDCGTKLPAAARVCPLCGAAAPDAGIADTWRANQVAPLAASAADHATRRVRYFPRALHRAGVFLMILSLALLVGSFFGLFLVALSPGFWPIMSWLWLAMAMCALIGTGILLVATFGPWPLEP